MTTHPYASAYQSYWDAGWRGILPLPIGKKTPPPNGYTGRDASEPSYADVYAWGEQTQPHNLALRLPPTIIGIDVDDYDGKGGGDTLAELVDKYGALPATWLSTSRDDGISGIRLYRIPEGVVLPGALPGIEIIQSHHRYVVAWPSIHPQGRTYQWVNEEDGTVGDGVPPVDQLPALPEAWLTGLQATTNGDGDGYTKTDLQQSEILNVITAMPTGEPCQHVLRAAGKAMQATDRHDAYNAAVLAVCGAGRRGCPGAQATLQRLRASFIAEVTTGPGQRRTQAEADAEWRRNLHGAIQIVANDPQGSICTDETMHDWLGETAERPDENIPEQRSAYDDTVRRKATDLRITRDARELLAAEEARNAKPLHALTLQAFLAQPDEPVRYRVHDLWPAEGRVLLAAAAKAGKTTLVSGNLLPALVDGGQFLGAFDTPQIEGNVALFNMEVGENTLRGWMRQSGISNTHKVHVINLRGRASALTLASVQGRQRIADFLAERDVQVAILDPLAPVLASLGLDENANADVARFFAWWSEMLEIAGVKDDLIVHHTGHDGARSRGASRLLDEPDAIWNLTRDKEPEKDDDDPADVFGPVTPRYFQAYGRDVEVGEAGLVFDGATRKLTIVGGSKKQVREAAKTTAARERVLAFVAENPGCTKTAVASSGGKTDNNRKALGDLVTAGKIVEIAPTSGHRSEGFKYFMAGTFLDENTPSAPFGPLRPQGRGRRPESSAPQTPPFPTERGSGADGRSGLPRQDQDNTQLGPMLGGALAPCDTCGLPAVTSPCTECRRSKT